jgi:hypothetical protein
MSGTLGHLNIGGGGASLPQPVVRIVTGNDMASGAHDRTFVGGLTKPQWDAIKDKAPEIWLYRYKSSYMPKTSPHSGYGYDNTRGYVHPSSTIAGVVSGRNYSGGAHNTRGGVAPPPRQTEWVVTDHNRYDAEFQPELWFMASGGGMLTYPIQPIATANGSEHNLIGLSGQHTMNTGTRPNEFIPGFCNSGQTRGTQSQWFAFAYTVQDEEDPRNRIIGPLSEPVNAIIWPHVKVNYGTCFPRYDRGRKIKLRHM